MSDSCWEDIKKTLHYSRGFLFNRLSGLNRKEKFMSNFIVSFDLEKMKIELN
jgi:hypothetical protein